MIKMCYVLDMIVAFTMLVLSICLILVSFVVLKFSITFTISEEFREIGVMKAIGISSFKIRSLYLAKYLMLAVAGAVVGLLLSIPFSNLLLRSVSNNIVLEADNHFGLSVLGAVLVIVVILLFAFRCTGPGEEVFPYRCNPLRSDRGALQEKIVCPAGEKSWKHEYVSGSQ